MHHRRHNWSITASAPASARIYAEIVANPSSWVEITAGERHPGGTSTQTDVAAGVPDSPQGRLVSLPRRVGGELYGSFLSGTQENLQRTLDGLLEFLPSRAWFDHTSDGAPRTTSITPRPRTEAIRNSAATIQKDRANAPAR